MGTTAIKDRGVKHKLTVLLLTVSVIAILALGIAVTVAISMVSDTAIKSNELLGEQSKQDSVTALQQQLVQQLSATAADKALIADSMLLLARNQTTLVANSMESILRDADIHLKDTAEGKKLPDLWSNNEEQAFGYSNHVRVPLDLLIPDSIKRGAATNKNGDVIAEDRIISAQLDMNKQVGKYTVAQQLYLAYLIRHELKQIESFRNADGTYTGFSASYFCFEDSGLDVLGDLETQQMIEYDGRESGWYKAVKAAYESGTMKEGDVFWTDPMPDASGRGVSLICATPVVVDGVFMGVAGSGGLLINFADLIRTSGVGETGYSFVINRTSSKVIINPNATDETASDSEATIHTILNESPNTQLGELGDKLGAEAAGVMELTLDGRDMYAAYAQMTNVDWGLVTVIETSDDSIMTHINALSTNLSALAKGSTAKISTIIFISVLVLIFLVLITLVAIAITSGIFAKRFTKPILALQDAAKEISDGKLYHHVDIRTGDELEALGRSFNKMTKDLLEYMINLKNITAEKERIGAELNVATQIQASMLPCIFPAFPDRKEFEIYATMQPAKEVGGDFYDFFLIDDNHLAMVMADVSGKGVPAALFMVIAKTLIKNHAQVGASAAEVFTNTNAQLCEGNEAGLFVTAWMGVLEINTGKFIYVNAGHNPPLLKRKGGQYEYLKSRAGFVLAGMEGLVYKQNEMQLDEGDVLYLYTDGVTEATDTENELYGEDRLADILNQNIDMMPFELLRTVREDIDVFVKGAPQFDDITMLGLIINPKEDQL